MCLDCTLILETFDTVVDQFTDPLWYFGDWDGRYDPFGERVLEVLDFVGDSQKSGSLLPVAMIL